MRCFSEKTFQEYLDGEVSKDQSRQIEQHLSECHRCKQKLVSQKAQKDFVIRKLRLLDPIEMPVAPVINSRPAKYGEPLSFFFGRFFGMTIRLPMAVVAMVVLFLAGLSLGLFLRSQSALTSVFRSKLKSVPFYISSDKSIQTVWLNLDLANYKPIAQPRIIITQEVTK